MISEKNIVQTDFKGKKFCKEIPGEKIPSVKKSLIVYNAGRKNLTSLCAGGKTSVSRSLGKKFLPQPFL